MNWQSGSLRLYVVAVVCWIVFWAWHVSNDCWWLSSNWVSCHHFGSADPWFDTPQYDHMAIWLIGPPALLGIFVLAVLWVLYGFRGR